MVRNKIKMFAQQKVTLPAGKHKIVILDEADRSSLALLSLFLARALSLNLSNFISGENEGCGCIFVLHAPKPLC